MIQVFRVGEPKRFWESSERKGSFLLGVIREASGVELSLGGGKILTVCTPASPTPSPEPSLKKKKKSNSDTYYNIHDL